MKKSILVISALFTALFLSCLATRGFDPSTQFPQTQPPHDFSGFYDQVDDYLARYHDPAFPYDPGNLKGNFSYQPGEPRDLYGTTDVVYLLWTMDELEPRTTPEGRAEWISLIQSYQDPETGWFSLGNETLHFNEHATAYSTGALALLGAKPLHPFKWKERMTRNREDMEKWLEQIWWWLVWVGSHEGGGVAASFAMTGEAPDEWFDDYFNWLDREANPQTGLWQRAFYNRLIKKTNKHDIGGAAHFWWVYQQKGRPIPYPAKVIDTCLSLQLESGLWDKKRKKGDFPYCINLDAVNGINLAYFQLLESGEEYRRNDIAKAFSRYLKRCAEVLSTPGNIERLYTDSHDLPGALIGVVEADSFFMRTEGRSMIKTRKKWRNILDVICWL